MSVISSIAPGHSASVYGGFAGRSQAGGGQIIRSARSERETVIDEPVIEHEHHHIHHHIDHGSATSIVSRRDREYGYESRSALGPPQSSVSSVAPSERRRHRHRHRGSDGITRISHSEVEINEYESGRSSRRSFDDDRSDSAWTMIDVPPGTRRITLEADEGGFSTGGSGGGQMTRREFSSSQSSLSTSSRIPTRGVRRSKGMSTELWTEITKDLCTRDAIEEMGYPYEETEYYFYIFDYLEQDQVRELIDLTTEIRHERVRELEHKRRIEMIDDRDRSRRYHYDYDDGPDRVTREREIIRDHVTEVSFDDDRRSRRSGASRRYY